MCICGKKYKIVYVLRNIYISARLDGTGEKMRSKMSQHSSIEDWLELGAEIVDRKPTKLGQKRVRWLLSRYIVLTDSPTGVYQHIENSMFLHFL